MNCMRPIRRFRWQPACVRSPRYSVTDWSDAIGLCNVTVGQIEDAGESLKSPACRSS